MNNPAPTPPKKFLKRADLMQFLYSVALLKPADFTQLLHFEELLPADQKTVIALLSHLETVDTYIARGLNDYTLDRLNLVDLSIIRLATYSILFQTHNINHLYTEMLELTKEYSDIGDLKQKSFNHRLLNNIKEFILNERDPERQSVNETN
jgi:N utilization substance protein B